MDWTDCMKSRFVKQAKSDLNMEKSLAESASRKLKTQAMLALNDTTASSKIVLAYDALRELLEALALSKGFKLYNHECYCAFLSEVMGKSSLGERFDRIRKIRNNINYYGFHVKSDEAEQIISEIESLIAEIGKKQDSKNTNHTDLP